MGTAFDDSVYIERCNKADIYSGELISNFVTHAQAQKDFNRLRIQLLAPDSEIPYCNDLFSSKAKMHQLSLVDLGELRFEMHCIGGYLVGEVLDDAFTQIITHILVGLPNDRAIELRLMHMTSELKSQIKKGSCILIKEPCVTNLQSDNPVIFCSNPTDVIIVRDYDPEYRKYGFSKDEIKEHDVSWKEFGNVEFRKGNYFGAIDYYTQGIHFSPDADCTRVLLINRSACYFSLERYTQSLFDLHKAFEINESHLKGNLRAGKCHYMLRDFEKARIVFQEGYFIHKRKEFKVEIAKCIMRMNESLTGVFDMWNLYQDALAMSRLDDCADFQGPVKIIDIPGKGRGLVSTEDIKPGRLLIASKAIASICDDEIEPNQPLCIKYQKSKTGVDYITYDTRDHCLITKLVECITKNPRKINDVINLSSGMQRSKDAVLDEVHANEILVDIEVLSKIAANNAFSVEHNICGLWNLPSYINHSCVPNSSKLEISDMMFIRATNHIAKGTL